MGKASWAEKCLTAEEILHCSPGLFLYQREMVGIHVMSVRIHCMSLKVEVDVGSSIALDFSESRRQQTTKMPWAKLKVDLHTFTSASQKAKLKQSSCYGDTLKIELMVITQKLDLNMLDTRNIQKKMLSCI